MKEKYSLPDKLSDEIHTCLGELGEAEPEVVIMSRYVDRSKYILTEITTCGASLSFLFPHDIMRTWCRDGSRERVIGRILEVRDNALQSVADEVGATQG